MRKGGGVNLKRGGHDVGPQSDGERGGGGPEKKGRKCRTKRTNGEGKKNGNACVSYEKFSRWEGG